MPIVYLGLGSNTGNRQNHLRQALAQLERRDARLLRISPVVESPALLPSSAPNEWNLPFLNLVLEAELTDDLSAWQTSLKQIEKSFSREHESSWAPRAMDIDILLWADAATHNKLGLSNKIRDRNFVLSLLIHLQPDLILPRSSQRTVFQATQTLNHHIPLWMGILNITPDSFSDGGSFTDWQTIETHLDQMFEVGVHIIDIGAESTRPGATALTADQEWVRLQPVLEKLFAKYQNDLLRPKISIDTYHPKVAEKSLQLGADMINDVSGLSDERMLSLVKESGKDKDWIAMHNLTIPADSNVILPADCDPYQEVEQWLLQKMEVWDKAGLDLNRIIFDPGVGFGKDGLQSLRLLQQAGQFRQHGLRILIGHSRKSFLKNLSGISSEQKDLATLGASLQLCQQNADIIRVHNVPMHVNAYRGWMHLQADS